MQGKSKLTLIAAAALLLLLLLALREGQHAPASVEMSLNERADATLVEQQHLAPAPDTAMAERRDLAELEAAPELEYAEPTGGLAAEAFSLRVTLRELDGGPLAPGSASILVADRTGQSFGATPDAEGVVLLTDLAPGRWWVRGSAAGRMTETRELHLPDSDARLELELRLAPRPHVRIVVSTPDGRPFADTLPPGGRTLPSATASRRRPEGWLGDVLEAPRWDDCGTFMSRPPTEPEPALLGQLELDCAPPLWVSLHLNEDVLEAQLLEPGIGHTIEHRTEGRQPRCARLTCPVHCHAAHHSSARLLVLRRRTGTVDRRQIALGAHSVDSPCCSTRAARRRLVAGLDPAPAVKRAAWSRFHLTSQPGSKHVAALALTLALSQGVEARAAPLAAGVCCMTSGSS